MTTSLTAKLHFSNTYENASYIPVVGAFASVAIQGAAFKAICKNETPLTERENLSLFAYNIVNIGTLGGLGALFGLCKLATKLFECCFPSRQAQNTQSLPSSSNQREKTDASESLQNNTTIFIAIEENPENLINFILTGKCGTVPAKKSIQVAELFVDFHEESAEFPHYFDPHIQTFMQQTMETRIKQRLKQSPNEVVIPAYWMARCGRGTLDKLFTDNKTWRFGKDLPAVSPGESLELARAINDRINEPVIHPSWKATLKDFLATKFSQRIISQILD